MLLQQKSSLSLVLHKPLPNTALPSRRQVVERLHGRRLRQESQESNLRGLRVQQSIMQHTASVYRRLLLASSRECALWSGECRW